MPARPDWVNQLLAGLDRAGPEGQATAHYVHQHGIHLGLRRQATGARWMIWKRIELHPRHLVSPADPYALSLVVHEVRHLQQGWLKALSVYGELDAWQRQFRFLEDLLGRSAEAPGRNPVIAEVMSLPVGWDRAVLRRARGLMRTYGGPRYRIDLLPLYPFHRELLFWLTRRQPSLAS